MPRKKNTQSDEFIAGANACSITGDELAAAFRAIRNSNGLIGDDPRPLLGLFPDHTKRHSIRVRLDTIVWMLSDGPIGEFTIEQLRTADDLSLLLPLFEAGAREPLVDFKNVVGFERASLQARVQRARTMRKIKSNKKPSS